MVMLIPQPNIASIGKTPQLGLFGFRVKFTVARFILVHTLCRHTGCKNLQFPIKAVLVTQVTKNVVGPASAAPALIVVAAELARKDFIEGNGPFAGFLVAMGRANGRFTRNGLPIVRTVEVDLFVIVIIEMSLGVDLFVVITGSGAGDTSEQGDGDEAGDENLQELGSPFAESALRSARGLANGGNLI
jgi:hypothetical protein